MRIKTERNFRRVKARNEKELIKYLSMFTEDCMNSDKDRWKALYYQYERMWIDFANRTNRASKEITLFVDGFEASILKGYDLLQDRSNKKLVEVLFYFKKKSWFEIVKNYLKNYYARALS